MRAWAEDLFIHKQHRNIVAGSDFSRSEQSGRSIIVLDTVLHPGLDERSDDWRYKCAF